MSMLYTASVYALALLSSATKLYTSKLMTIYLPRLSAPPPSPSYPLPDQAFRELLIPLSHLSRLLLPYTVIYTHLYIYII